MTRLRTLIGVVVCSGLTWAAPAVADPVTDWNEAMLRAGLVAATSPIVMTSRQRWRK
jgi:hypothetical protein